MYIVAQPIFGTANQFLDTQIQFALYWLFLKNRIFAQPKFCALIAFFGCSAFYIAIFGCSALFLIVYWLFWVFSSFFGCILRFFDYILRFLGVQLFFRLYIGLFGCSPEGICLVRYIYV